MKKASSIRTLLGISQTDIAQLLKIHRSQYAMFEIGKRDLPRDAKLLIAKMLEHTAKPTASKTLKDFVEADSAKQYLTGMLQENELQRLRCAKKLSALHSAQEKNHAILRMAGFLTKSAKKEPEYF